MKSSFSISRFDPLVKERSVIITIVLYALFVLAALFIFITTDDIIYRFVQFVGEPHEREICGSILGVENATLWDWLHYNYGKGWVPGWLIGIAAGICNYRVIKGHRDGVAWLIISLFVIIFPTVFISIEEAIAFSLLALLAIGAYRLILLLPRKGKTYWSICEKMPRWLVVTNIIVVIVWIFFMQACNRVFDDLYGCGV